MQSAPITRVFDSHAAARRAEEDLIAAGIPDHDVSIISRAGEEDTLVEDSSTAVATGATVGTIIGGGLGTLAGIGAMAIPGVGPIVAAGWLVAALTGAGAGAAAGAGVAAAAGSLYDTLHQTGLSEEHANIYAESVKRGGTLLMVRTDNETWRAVAENILNGAGHVDIDGRAQEWRDAGWQRFDPTQTTVETGRRYGS